MPICALPFNDDTFHVCVIWIDILLNVCGTVYALCSILNNEFQCVLTTIELSNFLVNFVCIRIWTHFSFVILSFEHFDESNFPIYFLLASITNISCHVLYKISIFRHLFINRRGIATECQQFLDTAIKSRSIKRDNLNLITSWTNVWLSLSSPYIFHLFSLRVIFFYHHSRCKLFSGAQLSAKFWNRILISKKLVWLFVDSTWFVISEMHDFPVHFPCVPAAFRRNLFCFFLSSFIFLGRVIAIGF